MIHVAVCTLYIGTTFIAASPHLSRQQQSPLLPPLHHLPRRRSRTQVQPRLQPQFPPLNHHEGAPTTGNFIRPAKSRMVMTARGGATEHTVARIIRCCIGIISIAGHLPLSPRLPRRPRTQVQPRLQPQFFPLPPVHHQGCAPTTGNFIRPAKSRMGMTARGGASEHTVARIIRCCIGIISIAGHLPLSPRLPRRPRTQVQPRLQPQFLPLPPVHHQGCAPSTGNFIRPAKSRMGMTARGGASEHTVARIIRCCIGIISIAGHYHIPRFLHLPRRPHTLKHYHIPRSLRRNHKNGTDHLLTDVRNVKDTDFHSYLELTFNL